MKVHVLGTGCAKCVKLFEQVEKAVAELGGEVEVEIEKVETIDEIMSFGVFMTPGLVVDGQVKAIGKVPRAPKIAKWIREAAR